MLGTLNVWVVPLNSSLFTGQGNGGLLCQIGGMSLCPSASSESSATGGNHGGWESTEGYLRNWIRFGFLPPPPSPVPPLGTQNDLGLRISRIFFYLCNQCDDILEVHADQTSVALIFLGSVFGENGQAPLRPQSDNNNNNSKRKRKHLWVSLYAYVDRSIIQSYLGEEPLW